MPNQQAIPQSIRAENLEGSLHGKAKRAGTSWRDMKPEKICLLDGWNSGNSAALTN